MMYKTLATAVFALALSGVTVAADFKAGEDYILTGAKSAASSEKIQVTEFFGYWCPHCNNFEPLLEKWVAENASTMNFNRVPIAFSTKGANQTLAQQAYFIGKQARREKAVDATMFDFYHKYGRLASSFRDLDKIKNDPVACNAEVSSLIENAEKQSAAANRPFDVASVTKYLTENVCQTDENGWALLKLAKEARGSIGSAQVLKNILDVANVDTSNFEKRLNSFSMKSALKSAKNKMQAMGIDSVPTIVVNDKYRVVSTKGFGHMLEVVEYLVEKEKQEAKDIAKKS